MNPQELRKGLAHQPGEPHQRPTAQTLRFAAALKAVEASVRLGYVDTNDDPASDRYVADLTLLVTVAGVDHTVHYQRHDNGVLSIRLLDDSGLEPLFRALLALHDEPAPSDEVVRDWYYGNAGSNGAPSPARRFADGLRGLLDQVADAEMRAFDAEREATNHHVVLLHVNASRLADFDALAADRGLGREGALRRLMFAALRDPSLLDDEHDDGPAPPDEPPTATRLSG
ncbi:hypothetical protein [Paraburkholderia dilworthii]|uniref:Uncharacterized protein n=1 Tax=Paraburkholderia dilworthii TaxID=948106 RepID=A0ABW9D793_9BURK